MRRVILASLLALSYQGYLSAQGVAETKEPTLEQTIIARLDSISRRLVRLDARLKDLEERADCAIPKPCIGRITGDLKMPPLRWHFQTPAGYERVGLITYSAFIEYCHHKRHDRIMAPAIRSNNETETIVFEDGIVQGGRLTLKAAATVRNLETDETIEHEIASVSSIRGSNPSVRDVKERLGDLDLQVMAFQESRFAQFKFDGLPLFGVPNGYGIMQLDNPPATASQIWDWQTNIDAGIALFAVKGEDAVTYPGRVREKFPDALDFTPEQLRLERIQRYNGGRYWNWNDEEKRWEKAKNSGYADHIDSIVARIKAGDFPSDWHGSEEG